jgi:aminoglycoside phosphotransferase (APT) family kinase protein
MLDQYAKGSDRDLSAMSFYLALAYFKLGVILEGIHYRYTQGKTVGAGFEQVGAMVAPIVEAGQRALEEGP